MIQSLTDSRQPWHQEIIQWCHREFGDEFRQLSLHKTTLRPFSEIQILLLRLKRRTRMLVCKRMIHAQGNKIYESRGNAAEIEFNALQRVLDRCHPDLQCPVPRPRLVLPQFDLLVMDFAEGQELDHYLAAARYSASAASLDEAADHFRRTGQWLKSFQSELQIDEGGPEALDQTMAHCNDRLKMIQLYAHSLLPDNLHSRVMKQLYQLQKQIREPVPVSDCHGDFGPWNVLVRDQRAVVIDFFAHRRDCVLTDPMGMLIYLESQARSLSLKASRIRRLQEAFCRGFDCRIQYELPLVRLCEAHHRIRRVHDCLMDKGVRWNDRFRTWHVLRDNLDWLVRCGHAASTWTTFHNSISTSRER